MPHFGQMFLTDIVTTHGLALSWFLATSMVILGSVFVAVLIIFWHAMSPKYYWAAPLESDTVEFIWILCPIGIVAWMGYWNTLLLYSQVGIGNVDFTICITGHQWYWEYTLNYNENYKYTYLSYAIPLSDLKESEVYLYSADYPLVMPGGLIRIQEGEETVKKIVRVRLLVTSADVLHSFSVPSFGVKMDACPGRIHEVVVMPRVWGVYYGLCSELCGRLHSAMPINIEVVPAHIYLSFVKKNMERIS